MDYGSEEDIFLLANIPTVRGEEAPITDTAGRCEEKLDSYRYFNDLKDYNTLMKINMY